jgi:hypothetical protein
LNTARPTATAAKIRFAAPAIDLRPGGRDLRYRPQGPGGHRGARLIGGDPREVALEARGRADDQRAGVGLAVVGERVRDPARGEGELARAADAALVAELEGQLALEHRSR